MHRRLALRLTATATLALFYPSADSPPVTNEEFIRGVIANNERLARMLTAKGWPSPTSYMGEGIQRHSIQRQYAGLDVQTSRGSRFVLILLDGNSYRIAGVFASPPDRLPAKNSLQVPLELLAKNISWTDALRLLGSV
ncbi:MAG: hypothetical protein HZB75_02870 [Candidatus Saccharibacteria bacterium]|nr:MAG: hypothetical protein HZB75_02870 [Candidatus Saccharibacteria bacterium]